MSGHQHGYHPHQQHQEEEEEEEEGQNAAVFTFPNSNNIIGYNDQQQVRSMGLAPHQELHPIRRPENTTKTLNAYDPAPVYETAGMLSEMFNFGHTGGPSPEISGSWYGQGQPQRELQLPRAANDSNTDNNDGMQLFLTTNPPPRSPSAAPPPTAAGGSILHMLLPSPHNNQLQPSSVNYNNPTHFFKPLAGPTHQQPIFQNLQGFGASFGAGTIQEEIHMGFGSLGGGVNYNVLRTSKYAKAAQELLEEFCSVGRGSQLINNNKSKLTRQNSSNPNSNPNPNPNPSSSNEGGESTSSKNHPPLSTADKIEHQRRKVKLLSMLDEVDRRYNHYCEQMQMVVNSFDMVMGYGSSIPYTSLAQKAMSRHFRCLKEGIQTQLRQSCSVLGEKDPTGNAGLTKGETPRLKILEQSLRHQRAFHQMGLIEPQDAWRPQRGLPERSVNFLRAWLFEHFLNPYPSDADKQLLSRQTGLSRNQVANWFINARVRLWKPMIEEMYQQEEESNQTDHQDRTIDHEQEDEEDDDYDHQNTDTNPTKTNNNLIITTPKIQKQQQQQRAQNPIPSSSSSTAETMTRGGPPLNLHHHIQAHTDTSLFPINRHHHHHQLPPVAAATAFPAHHVQGAFFHDDSDCQQFGDNVGPATMIRFGTAPGDVSLTLGLRHAGNNSNNHNINAPDKTPPFSLRDFGST